MNDVHLSIPVVGNASRLELRFATLSTVKLSTVMGALCLVVALALSHGAALAQPPTTKPNVVLILADDLGYGDLHCYNPDRGRIPTPRIDQLAAQGMRFTDAHSSSGVCSPSRYTLLTGRYHWRTRLQAGIVGVWGKPLIAPDRLTIARLAQQQGYRTACIGKWHLGWEWPIPPDRLEQFQKITRRGGPRTDAITDQDRAAWRDVFSQPIGQGPTTRGFDSYFGTDVPNWPPYCFIENDRTVGIPSELLPADKVGNNQASLHGPAIPQWRLEAVLPALRDRACQFIEEAAREPRPFLLYLPLTSPHTPLAVNPPWRGKSRLDNACADLIMETDAVVGDVLDALDRSGAARNTLVILTSDNGFAAYAGAKDLERQGHFPSGPLRDYKASVYEGGHRVAFIARWPGTVAPGTTSHQLIHHADVFATLGEVLGTTIPEDAGEDSFSLLPLLRGVDQPIREFAISCGSNGTLSLRQGSWKYIHGDSPQLYDLANDLSESNDRAGEDPQRVTRMREALEAIIVRGRSSPGAPQKNDVRVRR